MAASIHVLKFFSVFIFPSFYLFLSLAKIQKKHENNNVTVFIYGFRVKFDKK